MVSLDKFKDFDLRVGEVISADPLEGSDKLFVLQVDVGGRQVQLVAGLRGHYSEDEIVGKKIVVITNLEPATIRGVESQGMLLAAIDGSDASLLTIDRDVAVGSKVM
ncbi:MAG: methionine--tRNA ligase subunit beta [Candidatus Aenigmarchaeota archaeon]|nr:methionine--tRNA ligase subunit beta [Candidatus Aenigmarchaeota archaeon]